MRRIDELHLELPFYGSRRMTFELNKEGRGVNRKRVRRLMRVMGIEALVPRPGTSKAAPGHTTLAFDQRRLRWFATRSCKPIAGDQPHLSHRFLRHTHVGRPNVVRLDNLQAAQQVGVYLYFFRRRASGPSRLAFASSGRLRREAWPGQGSPDRAQAS